MSKLDEILYYMEKDEMGYSASDAKPEIKKLILDLFKEVDYEPFEFVDRVSKL